ncbi:MAG: hypothetical protein IJ154_01305 [Bacteroidales bacterium]|nr:hypothetical protein [Bacteroidales bacterium]
MKLNRILFGVLGLSLLAFASCQSDKEDYEFAPQVVSGAYLSADTTVFQKLPSDAQTVRLVISRVDTLAAGEVTLKHTNDKFDVPATVSFAAGEASKEVVIPFAIASGTNAADTVTLTSEAYPYGAAVLVFDVTVVKEYAATFVSAMFEDSWDTPVYEIAPGKFMIPGCYEEGFDLIFTISGTKVTFADQKAWDSASMGMEYGIIWVVSNPAGSYDAENGIISAPLFHHLEGSNSGFGTEVEQIVFTDEKP